MALVCKSRKPSKVEAINCAFCVKNSCTDREMEDRWVQLIMSRLHLDPKCQLPDSSEMSSEEDSRFGSNVKEAGGVDNDDVLFKKDKPMNDQVDLPAIMLAAHLLQQSGFLLAYVPSLLTQVYSTLLPSTTVFNSRIKLDWGKVAYTK